MTRKRIGTGLLEAFTTECPQCHGRGYELHDMPVESQKQADGGARESRPRRTSLQRSNQLREGGSERDGDPRPRKRTPSEAKPEERPAARTSAGWAQPPRQRK